MTALAPHSTTAEQALLGAALFSPGAAEVLCDVPVEDFYGPANRLVAEALVTLELNGQRADAQLVSLELERLSQLEEAGGKAYLGSLLTGAGSSAAAPHLAAEITECAVRRRAQRVARELESAATDRSVSLEAVAERAREAFGRIDMPLVAREPDPDLGEFLSGTTTHDWLVPGLLERGDRLILTAEEGYGKSTALRQIAVCAAAGVHPFKPVFTGPVRVMVLDCENGQTQVRRALRSLAIVANQTGCEVPEGNLRVCVKPDGLDLLNRSDVRWLYERVQANNPELIVLGPLYKLHAGNPNDEEPAAAVARVLDKVRTRWGATLIIEAHSPHASDGRHREIRPYGASLWRRWPEFGLGLTPDKDDPRRLANLKHWRGAREEREWPELLRRGGAWPWSSIGA